MRETDLLPKEAIRHIASIVGCDERELASTKQLTAGFNGYTYLLGGGIILKILAPTKISATEEDFFRAARIQHALHKQGEHLAPALIGADQILNSRPRLDGIKEPFVLMEFIDGRHPNPASKADAAAMGSLLARFHKVSETLLEQMGRSAF
jgi:Ser/Thr protein kinase RdoA (MazF antagonist)